jgi:hypothetical protein
MAGRRGVREREALLRPCLALAQPLVMSYLFEVEMLIEQLEVVKAGSENHVWRVGMRI